MFSLNVYNPTFIVMIRWTLAVQNNITSPSLPAA